MASIEARHFIITPCIKIYIRRAMEAYRNFSGDRRRPTLIMKGHASC